MFNYLSSFCTSFSQNRANSDRLTLWQTLKKNKKNSLFIFICEKKVVPLQEIQ